MSNFCYCLFESHWTTKVMNTEHTLPKFSLPTLLHGTDECYMTKKYKNLENSFFWKTFIVVYFDQQTGALYAVRWSKSFGFCLNNFLTEKDAKSSFSIKKVYVSNQYCVRLSNQTHIKLSSCADVCEKYFWRTNDKLNANPIGLSTKLIWPISWVKLLFLDCNIFTLKYTHINFFLNIHQKTCTVFETCLNQSCLISFTFSFQVLQLMMLGPEAQLTLRLGAMGDSKWRHRLRPILMRPPWRLSLRLFTCPGLYFSVVAGDRWIGGWVHFLMIF